MGTNLRGSVFITGGNSGIGAGLAKAFHVCGAKVIIGGRRADTFFKGAMYVASAVLPLLRRQPSARLVMVGSGLGFVPLVRATIYSATKSAIHAFTVALRQQMRGSSVRVIELIPPSVATNLQSDHEEPPTRAMALDTFIEQAMRALDSGRDELPIGMASLLRIGSRVAPGRFLCASSMLPVSPYAAEPFGPWRA